MRLRLKILAFTVLPAVALMVLALWTAGRGVSDRTYFSLGENLERASSVLDDFLAARFERLSVAAQVVVNNPRFFSLLTLPNPSRDGQLLATIRVVARDFSTPTRSDVFEVLDRKGRVLASVGRASSTLAGRGPLARAALRGRPVAGILVERDALYQVVITPVYADGRVAGALMLGAAIGDGLAKQLRGPTHSEVTFLSRKSTTGSTLTVPADREALLRTVEAHGLDPRRESALDRILEVKGSAHVYLTLVRRIPGSSARGEQFYIVQRTLDGETAFLRGVQRGLVLLGILGAIAVLLVGLAVSERLLRPVRSLVRVAQEMERGNYEYPLLLGGRDEIGYLADRFREMRQRERVYLNSLQEVAKLRADFSSVASHELRTPISVIKGYQELFSQGTLGPITPEQERALIAIDKSLTGLTRLAEDAARMAQVGDRVHLQPGYHRVEKVVDQAVSAAMADAPDRKIAVSVQVQPRLAAVTLDGGRLAEAIANLVRNGIRFTPDGGSVTVEAGREHDDLVIAVRDSGVGIDEEERKLLFKKPVILQDSRNHHSSSTLEFKSRGLGLGLAIARGIVEAHGGTMGVESRRGEGSCFTIRVPFDCTKPLREAA